MCVVLYCVIVTDYCIYNHMVQYNGTPTTCKRLLWNLPSKYLMHCELGKKMVET